MEGASRLTAHADGEFPADPYPGVAPGFSFVHLDRRSHPVAPDADARDSDAPGGWRVDGRPLDAWLAAHGAPPLADRVPVLAFGSNRCPQKLTWLREHLGLAGPVVVLRAGVDGLAAVWAAGHRARDGARPATLAVVPGARETHAVWMATPDQVAVLDACEGRGARYDLVRLDAGRVRTEDGVDVPRPFTYWPAGPARAPLLVDGAPVRCAAVPQDAARDLDGVPAPPTPGVVTRWTGAPAPDDWPDRLFVYGTLQPGRSAWGRLAPHAVGTPTPATTRGRVHDTGRGYPAMVGGDPGDRAHGHVVVLRDPAAALPALDAYEGPEYRRDRAVAVRADGPDADRSRTWAWAWTWTGSVSAWPSVSGSWGA